MSLFHSGELAGALKGLALWLHYPDAGLQTHSAEIAGLLLRRRELSRDDRSRIEAFSEKLAGADLLELQAEYVSTFDHSKKVSLYLFEHVHGESRDRGQAMVELINIYRNKGLVADDTLLPDYLPLFLEFCAGLPDAEARAWLNDIGHVLQEIHVRLEQRRSDYALPLRVLLRLAGLDPAPAVLRRQAAGEERDDTAAAFDRIWMEAPVTFGPDPSASCTRPSATSRPRQTTGDEPPWTS